MNKLRNKHKSSKSRLLNGKGGEHMNDKIIHRGETMLISIEATDFPVTDLSDVVLT